ncbi:cell wall protein IFF6-like [Sinocyclocheilus rhinocerous]|uniref:cell wall protein IFF6-like n=1 Tax=Sinocyclocheilus rhinocerous TaxID=307959 RepID=UPI0007B85C62|nr:PREDICTED: cell wall protein IFF6-like [Sinocyclocheilus rhinocerous]
MGTQTTVQKSGKSTSADGCDMTPALRGGFQTLQIKSKKSRREAERRWIRGRDGGPGPCSGRGPGHRGRTGGQGGAGSLPGSKGGAGVDSVNSWTGAGSGVDSVNSWTGAGSGVDSVNSWTGAGSGVDCETTGIGPSRTTRHEVHSGNH